MYEPCVSGDLTIAVLSVIIVIAITAIATLWALLDRCRRTLEPTKSRCRKLTEDVLVLRQQKGALQAEVRSLEGRIARNDVA